MQQHLLNASVLSTVMQFYDNRITFEHVFRFSFQKIQQNSFVNKFMKLDKCGFYKFHCQSCDIEQR